MKTKENKLEGLGRGKQKSNHVTQDYMYITVYCSMNALIPTYKEGVTEIPI